MKTICETSKNVEFCLILSAYPCTCTVGLDIWLWTPYNVRCTIPSVSLQHAYSYCTPYSVLSHQLLRSVSCCLNNACWTWSNVVTTLFQRNLVCWDVYCTVYNLPWRIPSTLVGFPLVLLSQVDYWQTKQWRLNQRIYIPESMGM